MIRTEIDIVLKTYSNFWAETYAGGGAADIAFAGACIMSTDPFFLQPELPPYH